MKKNFAQVNIRSLLLLNIVSIVIIAFCDVFAFTILFAKGLHGDVTHGKFVAMVVIVSFITLLLIGSVVSFIYFLKLKGKNKK